MPLITNIKCAKLFIDALQRYPEVLSLPLGQYDSISSYRLVDLPGLVDIAAQRPVVDSEGVAMVTGAGVTGGFTLVNVVPAANGKLAP